MGANVGLYLLHRLWNAGFLGSCRDSSSYVLGFIEELIILFFFDVF
jgi:hypothetical protein